MVIVVSLHCQSCIHGSSNQWAMKLWNQVEQDSVPFLKPTIVLKLWSSVCWNRTKNTKLYCAWKLSEWAHSMWQSGDKFRYRVWAFLLNDQWDLSHWMRLCQIYQTAFADLRTLKAKESCNTSTTEVFDPERLYRREGCLSFRFISTPTLEVRHCP